MLLTGLPERIDVNVGVEVEVDDLALRVVGLVEDSGAELEEPQRGRRLLQSSLYPRPDDVDRGLGPTRTAHPAR